PRALVHRRTTSSCLPQRPPESSLFPYTTLFRSSITATTPPSDRVSPTFTFNSFTTPANGAGTSIVALSDSSVTRPWSCLTVSPTETSTPITGTSSNPPISGTRASFVAAMATPRNEREAPAVAGPRRSRHLDRGHVVESADIGDARCLRGGHGNAVERGGSPYCGRAAPEPPACAARVRGAMLRAAMHAHDDDPVEATRRWLQRAVIG